jgi:hypothetical protein
MANIIVCNGNIVPATFSGRVGVPEVLTCDIPWTVKPEPSTDFQGLIDLLSFNPEICASLIGACIVIFIIGYSGGKVSRILSRR